MSHLNPTLGALIPPQATQDVVIPAEAFVHAARQMHTRLVNASLGGAE